MAAQSKDKIINEARKKVENYILAVENGQRMAGKYEKLAVERYQYDMKTAHKRGFFFDEWAAAKVILFFSYLNHFKGSFAGKPFILPPWQAFIIWNLFGWKKNENNTRRFTEAYIEVAKKNGKSTFAAGIELYMLLSDNESAPEIYSAATTRDQAKIVFETAMQIARVSPTIKKKVKLWKNSITFEETAGTIQPVSSEAGTVEGKNSHCAIIDEYHLHKTSEVKDNLRSGMAGRTQPLLFTITTAGYNRQLPCHRKRAIGAKTLEGLINDDSQFYIIYSIDEEDAWDDAANFEKANPNIGASPSLEFLIEELATAKNESGEKEVSFKTKHLNMWVDAAKVWIPDAVWMLGDSPLPMDELEGATCFAGLDLASTRDVVAYVLVFPFADRKNYILPFFWIPEMNYMERVKKDGVNYDIWIKAGLMRTTPGNSVDYDFLERDILEINQKYNVRKTAYDRWNSSAIITHLIDEGLQLQPWGQGFVDMSSPCKALENMSYKGELIHAGNPIMRWMMSNIEIQTDPAGNIKIDKGKSSEKVDGPVAIAMALGVMSRERSAQPDVEVW